MGCFHKLQWKWKEAKQFRTDFVYGLGQTRYEDENASAIHYDKDTVVNYLNGDVAEYKIKHCTSAIFL